MPTYFSEVLPGGYDAVNDTRDAGAIAAPMRRQASRACAYWSHCYEHKARWKSWSLPAWAKDLDALSAKGRYFFSTTRCFFAVSKAAAEDEQSPAPTR